jgi:hypothetical protein
LARNVLYPRRMKTIARSERNRSPIFWSIFQLHDLAQTWFARRHGCGRCAGQILSSLLRAATAFSDAADGQQIKKNLQRVRSALTACETALVLSKGRLTDEKLQDALDRIDRIWAALDEIAVLDPKEWPNVAMSQAERPARECGRLLFMLQQLRENVKTVSATHAEPNTSEADDSRAKLDAA